MVSLKNRTYRRMEVSGKRNSLVYDKPHDNVHLHSAVSLNAQSQTRQKCSLIVRTPHLRTSYKDSLRENWPDAVVRHRRRPNKQRVKLHLLIDLVLVHSGLASTT
jgi:hypothetical protein